MYKAVNNVSLQEWSVESRDDLLLELETIDARRKPLDPPQEWTVYHLSEDGEILDKHLLHFPLETTIDLLLANFGLPKKKEKGGILSWLFKRKNKQDEPYLLPNVDEAEAEEDNTGENNEPTEGDDSSQGTSEQDAIAKIIAASALRRQEVPAPSPGEEEEQVSETKGTEEEVQEEQSAPNTETPAYPQEEKVSSERISDEVARKEASYQEEVVKLAETASKSPSQHLLHVLKPKEEASPLSSWNLQLEFAERIEQDVEEIDKQIQRLLLEKENHLRLLESIKTLRLK